MNIRQQKTKLTNKFVNLELTSKWIDFGYSWTSASLLVTHSNQTGRFCFPLHPCLMDRGGTQYCTVSMRWIQTKNNIYFYDKSESSALPFNHTSVPISFFTYLPSFPTSLPER